MSARTLTLENNAAMKADYYTSAISDERYALRVTETDVAALTTRANTLETNVTNLQTDIYFAPNAVKTRADNAYDAIYDANVGIFNRTLTLETRTTAVELKATYVVGHGTTTVGDIGNASSNSTVNCPFNGILTSVTK